MLCPTCNRPMRALFTSYACDYCDGLAEVDYHAGFVVHRGSVDFTGRPMYVFRTRTDAAVWRAANNLQSFPIREVLSEYAFHWRRSAGPIDVELADGVYELYPDHRFAPAPNRVFLGDSFRCRAA